jgi:hypothetical protein
MEGRFTIMPVRLATKQMSLRGCPDPGNVYLPETGRRAARRARVQQQRRIRSQESGDQRFAGIDMRREREG